MKENPTIVSIREALKAVIDPELGVNIVDLGLVYDVTFQNGAAKVTMTLTTPACPLDGYFREAIEQKLAELPDIANVEIFFTFEPVWDKSKMTAEARLELGFA